MPDDFIKSLIPPIDEPPEMTFKRMQAQVETIGAALDRQAESINEIKACVKDLPVAIAQIQTKLDFTIDDVDALKSKDASHEIQIEGLKTRVTILERDIISDGKAKMEKIEYRLGIRKESHDRFVDGIWDKVVWPGLFALGGVVATLGISHLRTIIDWISQ